MGELLQISDCRFKDGAANLQICNLHSGIDYGTLKPRIRPFGWRPSTLIGSVS
jgi:hypothetical protein